MTNYVWSATDKSGKKVIREIEAATAEDAKFVLLAQGCSDLELKEDDVISTYRAGFATRTTAEARLKHRDDPTVTFWDALRKSLDQNGLIILALLFFAFYSGVRGQRAYAVLYFAALLATLAYILFMALPSVYYRKLIRAADWSQWRKVLSLVATLKMIGRFRSVKVPATELTRYRAKALAASGRLDEALAEFKTCEGQPDCPSWLYTLFVGGFYDIAKQRDKAIECNLASIALKPTSIAWLDLANRYARYKRDAAKARDALVNAEKTPLADLAKPFHLRCRGIVAFLEGDYVAAKSDLETAITLVEKAKGRPFRDGHLALARGYLCCVLAKQGDLVGAKKCFDLAKKYLVATEENELLADCRRLTGEK